MDVIKSTHKLSIIVKKTKVAVTLDMLTFLSTFFGGTLTILISSGCIHLYTPKIGHINGGSIALTANDTQYFKKILFALERLRSQKSTVSFIAVILNLCNFKITRTLNLKKGKFSLIEKFYLALTFRLCTFL